MAIDLDVLRTIREIRDKGSVQLGADWGWRAEPETGAGRDSTRFMTFCNICDTG